MDNTASPITPAKRQVKKVAQTMDLAIGRRPVFTSLLRSFQPLLEEIHNIGASLETEPGIMAIHPPVFNTDKARKGLPILAEMPMRGLGGAIRQSASAMLPLLCSLPEMAQYKEQLGEFFLSEHNGDKVTALLEDMLHGSEKNGDTANADVMQEEIRRFAAQFVFAPVLRALAGHIPMENGEMPWDNNGQWNTGYCPVCGAWPAIGWLDKVKVDEKNAFLAGGGGKKHLHCSLCGANWKFRRGVCPSCHAEGDGVMQILRVPGMHGERVDWCGKCQVYCPIVDLREFGFIPDLDAMALCMVYLDMLAFRKNLRPLKISFWNQFPMLQETSEEGVEQ